MTSPLIPAATLILVREPSELPPEILMLERSARVSFAPGMLVFPGGQVDPHDFELAEEFRNAHDMPLEDLAGRIAAIRETIEETGIAVGLDPLPDEETLRGLQDALTSGTSFGDLLHRGSYRLDLTALTGFARWIPPESTMKRFDTRFYVAAAPENAVDVADGGETARTLWAHPDSYLRDLDEGRAQIMWPTIANLTRIAQFSSFAEVRADAELHGHHVTTGRMSKIDGELWFHIDEGLGYPVTSMHSSQTSMIPFKPLLD